MRAQPEDLGVPGHDVHPVDAHRLLEADEKVEERERHRVTSRARRAW